MRAILLVRGKSFSVYTLERSAGRDEVREWLSKAGDVRPDPAVVRMVALIQQISETGLPRNNDSLFDCWPEKSTKELFCELKKGNWRIGCHPFWPMQRLLLLTVFSKHRWKEEKEYRRAMGYLCQFRSIGTWEDTHG